MDRNHPDIEILRRLIRCDFESGSLWWNPRYPSDFSPNGSRSAKGCASNWNSRYANKPAFTHVGTHGYKCGNFLGTVLLAHRIIMAIHVGSWDFGHIDHQNGDRTDNRISNLRFATPAENLANSKSRSGSSSQYLGVAWHGQNKNWIASITKNYVTTHLGSFKNEADAALAYNRAAIEIHGDYARLNQIVENNS